MFFFFEKEHLLRNERPSFSVCAGGKSASELPTVRSASVSRPEQPSHQKKKNGKTINVATIIESGGVRMRHVSFNFKAHKWAFQRDDSPLQCRGPGARVYPPLSQRCLSQATRGKPTSCPIVRSEEGLSKFLYINTIRSVSVPQVPQHAVDARHSNQGQLRCH